MLFYHEIVQMTTDKIRCFCCNKYIDMLLYYCSRNTVSPSIRKYTQSLLKSTIYSSLLFLYRCNFTTKDIYGDLMKKFLIIMICYCLTSCSNVEVVYLNQGSVYSYDNTNEKIIYLTFDDGYPYQNTVEIVNILNEKNIKATFFFEGNFMDDSKELILFMYESGHIIANHTYSHTNITSMSNSEIKKEFIKFENLYKNITKHDMNKYFRPPQGKYTNDKLRYIESLGYDIFFWSVNFKDWDRKNDLGEEYAYNYITNNTTNGDIILMHTLTDSNVLALPKILEYFLEEEYEFKLLDYLVSKRENII